MGSLTYPATAQRETTTGKVHTDDRFINTVGNLGMFYKMAVECDSIPIQTRDRQFPKIIGPWP